MKLDPELFSWAVRCLSGEITSQMRMIAIKAEDQNFTFRYYLDCEPTEFIREIERKSLR